MALSSARIQEAQKLYIELLDAELAEVLERASASADDPNSYYVELPETSSVDYNIEELASRVARISNKYFTISRDCGIARAKLKQCEASYKAKYKRSLRGANAQEREANAMEASADLLTELSLVESLVARTEQAESYARLASESARKLLDKSQAMQIATARESAGFYMDKDFH